MAESDPVKSIEDRNLERIITSALAPQSPPLPDDLAAQLAARARSRPPTRDDLPLAAAVCSAAGILLLAGAVLLPAGRTDLRAWVLVLPAANLLLGPVAAFIVIRNFQGGVSNAET
ncbi:MAG: hypothetical protein JW929_15370 [Anaerolineales bacterium]|nr:hypothetical protein [Anaerolineales bacterium]